MRFAALTTLLFAALISCAQPAFTYSFSLPAVTSKTTPVVILLHGYGSNESDLFSLAPLLDKKCAVFSLRGLLPAGSGYAWYKLQFLSNHRFKYDYAELRQSRIQILSFVSFICRKHGLDSNSVFLAGFSQGAIISYDIAKHAPGRIRGVAALGGRLAQETINAPETQAFTEVSFFIGHGIQDNVIPFTESTRAEQLLRKWQVRNVVLKSYHIGHTISREEIADLNSWLTVSAGSRNRTKK